MPLSFSSSKFAENAYSIRFGSWRLYDCYLVPTRENLEAFVNDEAKSEEENPFIDVFLLKETSPETTLSSSLEQHRSRYLERPRRIRKLHFQSVGGPLQVMFMHSTKENAEDVVMLNETEKDFLVLEKLMFREVIDLRSVHCDFVYSADRLMLTFMVHAMLFHVERMSILKTECDHDDETNDATRIPFFPTREFLLRYLLLLKSGNVPARFRRHYAMRLCEYHDWDQERYRQARKMFYEYEQIVSKADGTPKPIDPWEVFCQSDMIEEIVWHLINYSGHNSDVMNKFLNQIQRVESKMSKQRLIKVLSQMPWSDPWFQRMFEHPSQWSQRAREESEEFRRLGKGQSIIHEKRKSVDLPCFQNILSRTWNEGPAQKLVISMVGSFQCRLHIYFPTQEDWDSDKDITVTLFFFRFEIFPREVIERCRVNLEVRMLETNCLCGRQDMDGPRYEGTLKESGFIPLVEAIVSPVRVKIPSILPRKEWIEAHEKNCSMRFVTTARIGCMPTRLDLIEP